ncbi:MAG: hypothetical protein Q7U88_01440 [Desulfocapsaceae bacterium]|nr:hypothetical protein [Desulfocapsaceae bacterium]
MEQGHKDAGTASSIMVFSYFLCGALSMAAVSLDWPDKIRYIGILALISGSCALCLWLFLRRHLYLHCGLREQFLTSIPEKTGSSMISKVKRKKEISSVDKPLSRFICRKFGLPFNQYVSLTCAACFFSLSMVQQVACDQTSHCSIRLFAITEDWAWIKTRRSLNRVNGASPEGLHRPKFERT